MKSLVAGLPSAGYIVRPHLRGLLRWGMAGSVSTMKPAPSILMSAFSVKSRDNFACRPSWLAAETDFPIIVPVVAPHQLPEDALLAGGQGNVRACFRHPIVEPQVACAGPSCRAPMGRVYREFPFLRLVAVLLVEAGSVGYRDRTALLDSA